ncbi:IS1096 element passenger TnpR family protein [Kaistella sp.]|uniref:IS1096 element passenger TnpR family protein n=1 Tax=Kaistella sp. TaxID=2782235 RepID=UPI003C5C8D62
MVYKLRIILDTKEDIFRDIEIKDKQNLWNLHLGIKSAFSLTGDDLSIFNILDEDGVVVKTVPLEDMSDDGEGEIMSDVYISEVFQKVGDKIHFQYGFMDLWEFFCELIEINDEKSVVNYPITVFRFGKLPLKAPSKTGSKAKRNGVIPLPDDEFPSFEDEFKASSFEDEEEDDFDEDDDYNDDDDFDDDLD